MSNPPKSQPVEPPPTPPGGDGNPAPPNNHPSVGSLDALTAEGVVKGWARDPDLPDGAITVYFYVDKPMGFGLTYYAGATRASLPGKEGTEGANHAFAWRIPDTWRDGASHTLYVYAIDCSGQTSDSPLLGQRSFLLPAGNVAPVGALETVDGTGLATGWAVDPNTGHQALQVSFHVSDSIIDDTPKNRVLVGQAWANLARPDVNEATGCQGPHGFQWSVPAQYRDGSLYKLFASVTDTSTGQSTLLPGSPKLFSVASEQ